MTRWDPKLSEQSKKNLLGAKEQLLSIHKELAKKSISEMAPLPKSRLIQACQQMNIIFSEECGTAVKAADKVG